ncbi:MAG TPA: type II toxin-antitoxin system VapC family toxin [Chloroflexota bacterium]|nr:type II toxin-antitoxin system VapC family toxin [Chloroflexota bacterium]
MSAVYADTSALSSLYLLDEGDAAHVAELLAQANVVTSELTKVEVASSLARAHRDRRIDAATLENALQAFDGHVDNDGPITVLPLGQETFRRARSFVLSTRVRTLDALHLASARNLALATGEEVQVLTRDRRQAEAAVALGLPLHPGSALAEP